MSKRRLPPLNPLRNFEAAARCGSFTRAAAELNVTPAAVSRQVTVLENYFGRSLFTRQANIIELTADGATLLPTISTALDLLSEGVKPLARKDATPVGVCTYEGFAMHWLIPRLKHFRSAHPDIELNLSTASKPEDFEQSDADITIKYGDEPRPGQNGRPILPDVCLPVCHPALARGPYAIPPLANLAHQTLLRAHYRRLDWPSWLAIMGAEGLQPRHELMFAATGLAIQAALQGLGVAIAQLLLVENELASGQLIVPFNTALRRPSDIWISFAREQRGDDHVALVCDWIEQEARDTMAGFGLDYAPSAVDTEQALPMPKQAHQRPA